MNKIIFSLFTIYQLSLGNRLLLQTTAAPAATAAATAAATSAAPASIIPATTAAATTAAPAPATTAGAFVPPGQGTNIFNIIPGAGNPIANSNAPVGEVVCDFHCTTNVDCPSTCGRQRVQFDANGNIVPGTGPMLVNAGNHFKMGCSSPGACAQSDIFVTATGRYITEMDFSAAYAVWGSVITVSNPNPTQNTEIREINCGEGYCEGATFIFNGCDLGDFICSPVDIGKGCGAGCTLIIDGIEQTCNSVATW